MKDAAHAPAADESATRGVPPRRARPGQGLRPPVLAPQQSTQHTRESLSHTRLRLSAPPGVELVQDHSEAQLEEDREADEDPEVCGHVDVAHVVEAQHLLAVTCAQQIIA